MKQSDIKSNISTKLKIFALGFSPYAHKRARIVNQMPEIRGSIMSFHSASEMLFCTIGATMAGFLLLNYGWIPVGIFLGIASIIGGIIIQIFVKDPSDGGIYSI